MLGNQKGENLHHWLAIGCIEWDRLVRTQERAQRLLEALEAAVRNGDALAKSGGSKALARRKACQDCVSRKLRLLLEQLGDSLEQPLLVFGVDVEHDVRLRQQRCNAVHWQWSANAR